MTNAVSARSNFPTSWRGRTPGFVEFNALLNLMDEPALLVDNHRGQILLANSQLLQITAFTQVEISSTDLLHLIPEIASGNINPGEEHEGNLTRHNRDPLPVIARSVALDANNQWFLLTLTPAAVIKQEQVSGQRQERMLQAFHDLSVLGSQPDLSSCLAMAIRIAQPLLDASLICIYQADGDAPQLRKAAVCEPEDGLFFPETLPPINLIRLETPYLWLPGKKVTSELHRTARIANLNYLGSVPLGPENAWFGLLVAAGQQADPPEHLLALMEILAAALASAFQHYILVSNLNQTIQSDTRYTSINNAITENAQEGIILLTPALNIVRMNPAAELILGYASQEITGSSAESILIGADTITSALKSAVQGIPTHNLGNISLHRRHGQAFAAHIQTIPIFSANDLVGIVVFLSDISENEQIRVRTQQLEQRAVLGEVTAIFAHEVRNPINNISTGLQLMAMNLTENDPNQELIGRLQHDCSRLTHLMESVLSFSRPQEYKLEPTDLSMLLKRILDRWEPRMARVNIKSVFLPAADLPLVSGDPRALEQVFTNLISNAVQAMSSTGGTLAIKIELIEPPLEHPQLQVSFSDNGPGIPDEIRDHIFEPFVTTNPQGTGLGLAITKRIVTAHKGSINVTSFPGGTMFQVSLPAITGENV